MTNKEYYELISTLVENGLTQFHTNETAINTRAAANNIEYRRSNERPIAAFMTNFIFDGIKANQNAITMQELPLKGMAATVVNEIVEEINSYKGNWLPDTQYTSYNIDGFISFEEGSRTFDTFLEYKSEARFDELKMLTDFAKYRIYTNNSTAESHFFYMSFKKNRAAGDSFIPRTSDFEEIDCTATANSGAIFHYKTKSGTTPLDDDELKDSVKTIFTLDYSAKILREIPSVSSVINYSTKEYYKNRMIYGKNVLLSYKARANATNLVEIARKVITVERMSGYINTSEIYGAVSGYITKLKRLKVGENRNSNASKKLAHQGTNWLLATIDAGIEVFWNDQREGITFDISERTKEGHSTGGELPDFKKMKKAIIASNCYGMSNEQATEYSELDVSIEDFMEANNFSFDPQIKTSFKEMVARILFHINETYSGILTLDDDATMKPFNQSYKDFISKKEKIELFKKINSSLDMSTKRKLSINLAKSPEEIEEKMKEIVQGIIMKWDEPQT